MKRLSALVAITLLISPLAGFAQTGVMPQPGEHFAVGTFKIDGLPVVGLVMGDDDLIVELEAANRALEVNPAYSSVPMPDDMVDLIGRYEYGLKYRLYELADWVVAEGQLDRRNRPDYVHERDDVHVMAPIQYPGKILNAAVNFYSHVNEGGTPEQRAAEQRRRREERGVPYLFLKPARGAVIGADDTVIIPWGRTMTDWEVELGAVIGRPAKYVDATNAQDYIFGYIVTLDISDRGGRPPGGNATSSDWFVGKGHDTFAPMGPWIVPKEFYGDPMANLRQTLSVNGEVIQDAQAGDMIHSLYEIIEYASSIITLYPADVVNNGTSGGTGGRRDSGQRFLQSGEVIEASIDGIGTMVIEVEAEPEPPGGTGSRLPPVNTYR
ncbi:MAG: fumarylacetoacetate hydrolase family protein [Pseudohongiellaceae bacterium]